MEILGLFILLFWGVGGFWVSHSLEKIKKEIPEANNCCCEVV